MREAERRGWAVRAAVGVVDGIDLSLLDPSDADERRLLIEAEHREFQEALDSDQTAVTVGGVVMNPALHVALHQVVAQQPGGLSLPVRHLLDRLDPVGVHLCPKWPRGLASVRRLEEEGVP